MKVRHVVCWSVLVAFPHFALAATPPGETGAFQAIYDFCGKVDGAQDARFDAEAKSLYAGLTPKQIEALRKGSEYKRGYKLLSSILPKLTAGDAMGGCKALASPSARTPTRPIHESKESK